MRNILLMAYMVPQGIASGSAILIGKSIGQENKNMALQYYRIALMMVLGVMIIKISFLISLRE